MIHITVNDMICGHCTGRVTEAIKAVDAGAHVTVDLAAKNVAIDSHVAAEKLLTAIKDAPATRRRLSRRIDPPRQQPNPTPISSP